MGLREEDVFDDVDELALVDSDDDSADDKEEAVEKFAADTSYKAMDATQLYRKKKKTSQGKHKPMDKTNATINEHNHRHKKKNRDQSQRKQIGTKKRSGSDKKEKQNKGQ